VYRRKEDEGNGGAMKVAHISYAPVNELAEFLNEATYETVFRTVSKYVQRPARVLDVGSGRGELLKRLSESG
jgi:hypothetical protein